MGLAMIEEIMYPGMHKMMISPLLKSDESITQIYKMMKGLLTNNQFFNPKYGCPAINLIEEMAALNTSFNLALSKLTNNWKKALMESLQMAIEKGQINSTTNTEQTAFFIMSGYGGVRNLGKLYGRSSYGLYLNELKLYLQAL